jgi:sortase A
VRLTSQTLRLIRAVRRWCLIIGFALSALYIAGYIHGAVAAKAAILSFRAQQQAKASSGQNPRQKPTATTWNLDSSLWSPGRIAGYMESLSKHFDPPSGILRIEKLRLEAPVFEGTDELTLNRGVGRIVGTSLLEQPGNVGLAAHRDGFFRALKDIAVGERLELVTTSATYTYVVDHILIVKPDQVSVLEDRGVPSLTLVTCYPFYFVGDAPERFIVQSTRQN